MFDRTRVVAVSLTLMLIQAALSASTVSAGSLISLDNPTDVSISSAPIQVSTNNFHAHLSGDANVPSTDTAAQGEAIFRFDPDTHTMYYKITVANIEDVFASHIHCASAGVNGSVGVTLFFLSEPVSNPNGVLVEGMISEPDPGNQCGWTSLADVEDAIRAGNAYVNLHTTAHHSGEIRGQIR